MSILSNATHRVNANTEALLSMESDEITAKSIGTAPINHTHGYAATNHAHSEYLSTGGVS